MTNSKLLTLPVAGEGSADFINRAGELVAAGTSHIYVDTSFLMWMTKVGATSRKELVDWLAANCSGRVHVPIWAAHEYLRHHIDGTIVKELSKKIDEISDIAGTTYSYFRPFVDDAPLEAQIGSAPATRAATRDALNALDRLARTARAWHKVYAANASEVIGFINDRIPKTTELYNYLPDISSVGSGRFVGRVPPGFQDRNKKGSGESGDADKAPDGSNRFGDLLFWKEVLDHAKSSQIKCIVILTNDRKNDWHLGGGSTKRIEKDLLALKKSWKPVPSVHPMLELEARLVADVEDVVLLDAPYLGVLLRDLAPNEVRSFSDVAIIPDGPQSPNEKEGRSLSVEERRKADAKKADAEAARLGTLFPDPSGIHLSIAALRRALLDSRDTVNPDVAAYLESVRADVPGSKNIREVFTKEIMADFNHTKVVCLVRELHDRVVTGIPGYGEAAADLMSMMDELPLKMAACVYFGLLASMYLERSDNSSRLPPKSPLGELLFEKQASAFAAIPIAALSKRLSDNEKAPVYVPDIARPVIGAIFDIEPNTDLLDELRSLKINGFEILTPAQHDGALKLSSLFPIDGLADGRIILAKACELFAVPLDQIEHTERGERAFNLTPTLGFKRPDSVFAIKEQSGGN